MWDRIDLTTPRDLERAIRDHVVIEMSNLYDQLREATNLSCFEIEAAILQLTPVIERQTRAALEAAWSDLGTEGAA
jgi:hypothetical protein